jgi:hydroxymethylpyrimidine pyrophosphatase-like HAD family hydrolase
VAYTPLPLIKKLFDAVSRPDGPIVVSDFDGTAGMAFEVGKLIKSGNGSIIFQTNREKIPTNVTIEELLDPAKRDHNGYFPLPNGSLVSRVSYFARNNDMNVYAHPELVKAITLLVESGHPEAFIINTGRTYEQISQVLLQSGLSQNTLNKMILITNHGSELRIGQEPVINLKPEKDAIDQAFLNRVAQDNNVYSRVTEAISEKLYSFGINEKFAQRLIRTAKYSDGVVSSIDFHFQALVDAAMSMHPNVSRSALSASVVEAVDTSLNQLVNEYENSRQSDTNRLPFKASEENGIVEVKTSGLDKGAGMSALVDALDNKGLMPKSREIIFAGDSLLNNYGKNHRTDYSALVFLKSEENKVTGTLPYQGKQHNIPKGLVTAKAKNVSGKVAYIHHAEELPELDLNKPENILVPDPKTDFPADYPPHLMPDVSIKTPIIYVEAVSAALQKRAEIAQVRERNNIRLGAIGGKSAAG